MIDETDISTEKNWLYAERARIAVANLQRMGVNAQYVPTREEALSAVMEMIPEGVTVARGDSMSVDQVGVIPALRERNKNRLIDPFERDAEGHLTPIVKRDRPKMTREAFFADVFITGTNAVTLDGKMVSTDGVGNRVSATIFGPAKVILVVGANKIVKDLAEALERIHQVCTPLNAKRHILKHHRAEFNELPCVRTGKCTDCSHEWRMCRYTVIIEGSQANERGRINVVLVGEELGI